MLLKTTEKVNNKKLSIAVDVLLALMLGGACFLVFTSMFGLKWPGSGIFSGGISGGLAGIWDKIADKLGNLDYVILPKYKPSTASGGAHVYGTALTMILAAFSVISYFIIKSRTRLLLLIFAIPIGIMMLGYGVTPSVFAGGVFAAAIIIVLAVMRMDMEIDPKSLLVPLAIVLAAGVVLAAAENTVSLREPRDLAALGGSIKASIDKMRYGSDPLPAGDIGSISGKDLKNSRGDIESVKETLGTASPYSTDLFDTSDSFYEEEAPSGEEEKKTGAGTKTALTVKMTTPTSYYLRGFIGASYSRNKWTTLPNDTFYGMRDTIFWLNRRGFDGLSQMSRAAGLGETDGYGDMSDFSTDVFGDTSDDSEDLGDNTDDEDNAADDEDYEDAPESGNSGSSGSSGITFEDDSEDEPPASDNGASEETMGAFRLVEPSYADEDDENDSDPFANNGSSGSSSDPFADGGSSDDSSSDPFADGGSSDDSSSDPFADDGSSDGSTPYVTSDDAGSDTIGAAGGSDGVGSAAEEEDDSDGEFETDVEDFEGANEIIVKVKGASRRYAFVPYELTLKPETGKKARKSEMELPKGTKNYGGSHLGTEGIGGKSNYTYRSADNITGSWTDAVGKLYTAPQTEGLQNYFISESHYNVMQYDNYLELPDKYKSLFSAEIGSSGDLSEDHADYKETIEKISGYLQDRYIYSESFSKAQGREDLVEKFVESKSGCDMHFATLATLLFRYYGIPARYVEGYLITPHMIEGQSENAEIDVTRQSSHAWTEIYIDGFGWVPFEATPEYRGIMQEADMTKGLQNVEYENTPPEPDESEDDEFEDDDDEDDTKLGKKLLKMFLTLLILIIIACLIYIAVKFGRRIMEEKRWQKLFTDKDPGTGIRAMYQYSLNHSWELSDEARKMGLAASYSQAQMTESDRTFMKTEFEKAKAKAAEEKKKNKELIKREKAAAKAAAKQEKAEEKQRRAEAKAQEKQAKEAAQTAAAEAKAAAKALEEQEKAAMIQGPESAQPEVGEVEQTEVLYEQPEAGEQEQAEFMNEQPEAGEQEQDEVLYEQPGDHNNDETD